MRQVVRLGGLALAAVFASADCGCSDGTPSASSSTVQATVKGKVTHKGKPLAKVGVMFNPANVNRKSAASVTTTAGADGAYEITTLVGENTVSLVGPVATKKPVLNYFNLAVDVKAGENAIDLNVP